MSDAGYLLLVNPSAGAGRAMKRLPTIESNLKEGIMIGSGDEATANAGRRITKREMPW